MILPLLALACSNDKASSDTGESSSESSSYVVTSAISMGEEPNEVAILDRSSGESVWSYQDESGYLVMDAQLNPSGNSLFYFVNDGMGHDGTKSAINEIDSSGNLLEKYSTVDGHHSFDVFLDDSGERIMAYIKAEVREDPDYGPLVGDSVIEVREDGSEETIFSTFDVMIPQPPEGGWATGFYDEGKDWTHSNHLRYQEERGTYIMSMAEQNAVLEFDRNGEMVAAYLGKDTDTSVYKEATYYEENSYPVYTDGDFSYQHAPSFGPDGKLWVFSNHKDLSAETKTYSYTLDEDSESLVLDEEISSPSDLDHSMILGGAMEFTDGSVMINWSTMGILELLNEEREAVWTREYDSGLIPAHFTPVEDISDFLSE